jgi:hypothetical protein
MTGVLESAKSLPMTALGSPAAAGQQAAAPTIKADASAARISVVVPI